jgi:hypothetical protein
MLDYINAELQNHNIRDRIFEKFARALLLDCAGTPFVGAVSGEEVWITPL